MKRNLRIVHFISSLERGGAQTVLAELIEQLVGYDHQVIYIHGGPYEQWYAQQGIPLYQVRGVMHTYDPLLITNITQIVRKIAPDLLHTSLWAANLTGRIVGSYLRIPTVMTLHNRAELNGPLRMLFDWAAPSADCIIAVSDDVRNTFGKLYRAPFQVIHNGVAGCSDQDHTLRAQWGISDTAFVIGAVGRLDPLKRFDLLISSFAVLAEKYPHVALVILGTGNEEERLRAQIVELGLQERVRIIVGQDARRAYGSFDCFVLPSASEGVSMALLEAMGAGRACIITHNEPTHPVITSGHDGLLCEGSILGITSTIETILHNVHVQEELGKHARKTVANRFSNEHMINAYDELFLSVASLAK